MKITPLVKSALAALFVLGLPRAVHGRIQRNQPYEERTEKADLVVIAKPLATKTTGRKAVIEGINVLEVLTELEIKVVFKGDKKLRKVALRHYVYPPDHPTIISGPMLADFDAESWKTFLLFLLKEADGNYAPVFGQTDPSGSAVVQLGPY